MLKYRSDIDGLRAIAVGGVVLFHALPWSLTGGFIGVDVFFVLSGYLITAIIRSEAERGEFSIAKFYERRFRRIMPALMAVAIVTTIASLIILPPTELKNYGKSLLGVAVFASNFVFWMDSGYFDTASADKPLLHTWSLAVEEQFYILWPLIAAALVGTGRKRALPIFVIATVVVSLLLAAYMVRTNPDQAFYLLPYRAWELGMGALLAVRAVPVIRTHGLREILAILGIGLIVVPMALYTEATPFPGLAALPPCLGAFLIIYAGEHKATMVGRALSFRPILFVGLVSYSFYLWHWPLLVLPRIALSRELTTAEAIMAIAAAFILAVLSTKYIEARFRGRGTIRMTRRAVLATSLAAATATGIVGSALFVSNGLHFLASPAMLQAEDAVADINPYRDKCHASQSGTLPNDRACTTGKPDQVAGYDVLLWGDSHADHLMPGLMSIAAARHMEIRQATVSGCSPISQFLAYDQHPDACPKIYTAALKEASRQSDIDTVILSSRWSAILSYIRRIVTDGDTNAAARKFDSALRLVVAEVRQNLPHAKIIIVGTTPEFDVWPATCFARAEKLGTDPANCQERIATDDVLGPLADRVIAGLRDEGVTVVLPRTDFCDGRLCETKIAGGILFRDDDHLTTAGSNLVAKRLLQVLPTS